MGDTTSTPLYFKSYKGRVPHTILFKTSINHATVPFKNNSFLQRNGSSNTVSEDHGGSGGSTVFTKLPVKFISEEEGRRHIQTPIQSSAPKQIHFHKQIQINKSTEGTVIPSTQRLVNKNRFVQCLLSYTDRNKSSKIFKDDVPKQIITNDLFTARPGNITESVRNVHELDSSVRSEQKYKNSCVPRRFSVCQSEPKRLKEANDVCSKPARIIGVASELQKVSADAKNPNRVPWYNLGPLEQYKTSPNGKTPDDTGKDISDPHDKSFDYKRNTKPDGRVKLCEPGGASRTAELQKVIKIYKPNTQRTPSEGTDSASGDHKRPKMVAVSLSRSFCSPPTICQSPLVNRCIGQRLGSTSRQYSRTRSVDTPGIKPTLKCQGNGSYTKDPKETVSSPSELNNFHTVGQQDSPILPTEPGGNEIRKPYESDIQSVSHSSELQHSPEPAPHTRQVQYRGRPPISRLCAPRVASPTKPDQDSFHQVGSPSNGSFRIQKSSCSGKICNSRCNRQGSRICGCVFPTMELQPCLDISATFLNAKSSGTPEQCKRVISSGGSSVGEGFLETRPEVPCSSTTLHHTQHTYSIDRHEHQQSANQSAGAPIGDLEMWGWCKALTTWNTEQIELLGSSWRDSTKKSYKAAWKRWCTWASQNKDAGVTASAGSVRSAVASKNWISNNFTLDDILARGNWRSANTFQRFYKKEIRSDNGPKSNLVQNLFQPI